LTFSLQVLGAVAQLERALIAERTRSGLIELRAAGCATILEEHASGADRSRPVLAHLLREIRAGETLVVVRLDRLARSVSHLLAVIEQLEAAGAHFRSLRDPIDTSTPKACDTFVGQPPYRAAQPLDRPGGGCLPTVQDPHDIAPRLVGAHLPDGGQPGVQPRQDAFQMRGFAACAQFADGVRITGAQTGIAADAAAGARRIH
jgi:hypothetical protein